MGIYDQLHGECPYCRHTFGRKMGCAGFSGIQVKKWITGRRTKGFDFFEGTTFVNACDIETSAGLDLTESERCLRCDNLFFVQVFLTRTVLDGVDCFIVDVRVF